MDGATAGCAQLSITTQKCILHTSRGAHSGDGERSYRNTRRGLCFLQIGAIGPARTKCVHGLCGYAQHGQLVLILFYFYFYLFH